MINLASLFMLLTLLQLDVVFGGVFKYLPITFLLLILFKFYNKAVVSAFIKKNLAFTVIVVLIVIGIFRSNINPLGVTSIFDIILRILFFVLFIVFIISAV